MQHNNDSPHIRLNKFIAQYLHVGRRQADELITKGSVQVAGQTARLGQQITPSEKVVVNGKQIVPTTQPFVYVALYKPVGFVCSRRKQGDTPTIYALLPKKYHHLKPVGRLDKDSSGILLLTNDGDFAHRMTHPSFIKPKQYTVTLTTPLLPLHRQMINDRGVMLPDGKSKLQLGRVHANDDLRWHITMYEGRNRQIRRTFAALGYTVAQLHRSTFGPYQLGALLPKQYQEVSRL